MLAICYNPDSLLPVVVEVKSGQWMYRADRVVMCILLVFTLDGLAVRTRNQDFADL